jgi:ethanolamine utilization protein EutQ (cupin superfamily)
VRNRRSTSKWSESEQEHVMMDDSTGKVTAPFTFYEGRIPDPPAGSLEILEHVSEKTGGSMAGGIATYNDYQSAPWTVWYDEVVALHATDGAFEIDYDGITYKMNVGDFIWIRANTTVVYRSRGKSTLFYAAVPADWQARGVPPKPVWT